MGSLESLKICKVRKMISLSALHRGRNWVGVILPKIWGEMLAVGSPSRRRMWGTKRCLEHLMRSCRLRSAKTVAGHVKWHFHVWKSKKRAKLVFPKPKPHFFSSNKRKKLEFLEAIVGHKNLSRVIMPHVVSMADESIIVPRRPHARKVRLR